jgi:hypothetical protein
VVKEVEYIRQVNAKEIDEDRCSVYRSFRISKIN